MWSSLLALSRLYEMMEYYNQNAPSFQLYFRLVTSYDQVAFIILDNAHNEQHPDIEDRLQPVSPDVELLLHFRPFNVVSAQRILQFITPKELVSLSIGKMRARLRSRHLIRIIKVISKQSLLCNSFINILILFSFSWSKQVQLSTINPFSTTFSWPWLWIRWKTTRILVNLSVPLPKGQRKITHSCSRLTKRPDGICSARHWRAHPTLMLPNWCAYGVLPHLSVRFEM